MGISLRIKIPERYLTAKTRLTATANAGVSSLAVENNAGFTSTHKVIIDMYGKEKSEMITLSSSTATAMTLGANTSFKHLIYANVLQYKYDQVVLYSCATETGTYSIVGSYTSLVVDQPQGNLLEDTGSNAYYKVRFKNSVTSSESSLSDSPIYRAETLYCTIQDIQEEAGVEKNSRVSDELIRKHLITAQSTVDSYINKVYTLPLSSVPETIRRATYTLGASFLLKDLIGDDGGLAQAKYDSSLGMLQDIIDKKLVLVDSSGSELEASSYGKVGGYPDGDTAGLTGQDFFFSNDQTF